VPTHHVEPQDQLAHAERLGHVVLGAELEAGDAIGLAAARGQHDDRDLPRALLLAELARKRYTRHSGQHPVDQQQVGERIAHDAEGALGVAGAHDVVAGVLQVDRDQLLDRRFVFHQEDVRGHGWRPLYERFMTDLFQVTRRIIAHPHAARAHPHSDHSAPEIPGARDRVLRWSGI